MFTTWLKAAFLPLLLAVACGGSTKAPPPASPQSKADAKPKERAASEPEAQIAVSPDEAADAAPGSVEPDVRSPDGEAWIGAAATSNSLLYGQTEQRVAIWVNVPTGLETPRLPKAVTMTVDTSGSMAGVKIVHARESAHTVLDQLADGDIVALHSFATRVRQHLGPTQLSAGSRQHFAHVVSGMRATGSTNLFEAMRQAVDTSSRAPTSHPVRRVIVISDGRATAGPASPEVMGRLAEDGMRRGVQITALGIGLDYDEYTLNALAQRSHGRLYHVEHTNQLASIIEQEMNLIGASRATGAFVEIVPAPGVRVYGPRVVHHSWGQNGALRIPLGSVYAGQEREFVVRLRLPHGTTGERALLSVRLHYIDPEAGGLERVQETVVRAFITEDERVVRQGANPHAQAIVSSWEAVDLAASATREVNAGNYSAADSRLAEAESRLRDSARQAPSARMRKRMKRSADRVTSARRAVGRARSAPAAAQPRMKRAAELESNDAYNHAAGY